MERKKEEIQCLKSDFLPFGEWKHVPRNVINNTASFLYVNDIFLLLSNFCHLFFRLPSKRHSLVALLFFFQLLQNLKLISTHHCNPIHHMSMLSLSVCIILLQKSALFFLASELIFLVNFLDFRKPLQLESVCIFSKESRLLPTLDFQFRQQ